PSYISGERRLGAAQSVNGDRTGGGPAGLKPARPTPVGRYTQARPICRKERTDMAKVIGIDLGTTNSCVAVMEGSAPKVIENAEGARTTPSIVAFTQDGERLIGQPAKRQGVTNPEFTFFAIKRLIGRRYDDPMTKKDIDMVPYKIVKADNGDAWVAGRDSKKFAPWEISAFILQKMKETAEAHLGEKVTQAVITVPAYFNDAQRQATKDAGKIAGLEVLRLVNEPTAAALAYGLHEKQRGQVAVYDLGGGTFDISVLKLISTGEGDIYQVLSTNGDTHLGGDDIDNLLQAFVHEQILQHDQIDFSPHDEVAQELRKALISRKHQLSEAETATLRFTLPSGKIFTYEFTRGAFEALIKPVVDRTMGPVKQALADAQLKPSNMDEVVLVGGATRTPLIRRMVQEYFDRKPHTELNPDEVVALGAAVQANILDCGVKNMLL